MANALPRDLFLWSKFIGGYLVFVVPFLLSFLFGLLLLVWQGFPLGEPDIFPRMLCLTGASLLYIAVFFAIGTVISTYLDSSKTALIIAFTVWVFAVLIVPRVGFVAAKFIAPTQTSQSVYLQKTAIRENFNIELEAQKIELYQEYWRDRPQMSVEEQIAARLKGETELDKLVKPLETEYRLKFENHADEIDRNYQHQKAQQEQVGETFSRITPTSSLIYLTTNLTQTGKMKRQNYLKAGESYHDALHADLFSKIVDHASMRTTTSADNVKITQPPVVVVPSLIETLSYSLVDILMLCFFIVVSTTVAFLKFFCSDI